MDFDGFQWILIWILMDFDMGFNMDFDGFWWILTIRNGDWMEFHGDCPLVIEHNYGQPPFLVAENRWGLP